MKWLDLKLPTGSTPSEAEQAGTARLVNCFVEPLEQGKAEMIVRAVDGLDSFALMPDAGGIRAIHELSESSALVVAGRNAYRVDASGTATLLGGIPSDGLVTTAQNRVGQVAIVCDGLYFGYVGGVLTQLADPDLPPPISVAEMGGVLSFFLSDGRHFASEIDGWDIDALSFATAEAKADGGKRNIARGSEMVFFGGKSTEFWSFTGDDPYPFARTSFNEVGCLSGASVATVDQSVAFIAHDGTVRVLEGYNSRKISTAEIERLIAADASPTTISATAHYGEGNTFYTLTGSTWTREYNVATGRWHDRQSHGMTKWRVAVCGRMGLIRLAGDATSGTVYRMNSNTHTEAGEHLVAQIYTPPIAEFPNRIVHHGLMLDMVRGVGRVGPSEANLALTADDGVTPLMTDGGGDYLLPDGAELLVVPAADVDPKVMIDWSDDGVHYSTQLTRSIGRLGQTVGSVRVNKLGSAHSRTYRFGVSAGVRRFTMQAKVHASMAGSN